MLHHEARNSQAESWPPFRLLYPKREACVLLGISLRKLDYLIAEGRIRARRVGRRTLLERRELERFASGGQASGEGAAV